MSLGRIFTLFLFSLCVVTKSVKQPLCCLFTLFVTPKEGREGLLVCHRLTPQTQSLLFVLYPMLSEIMLHSECRRTRQSFQNIQDNRNETRIWDSNWPEMAQNGNDFSRLSMANLRFCGSSFWGFPSWHVSLISLKIFFFLFYSINRLRHYFLFYPFFQWFFFRLILVLLDRSTLLLRSSANTVKLSI